MALIGLPPENPSMKSLRISMLGLAVPLLLLGTPSAQALVALADDELSQVHAAGLPDAALKELALAAPAGNELVPLVEASAAVDHQQSLAQVRMASTTAQASAALMRSASLPALFTPLVPLVLPVLAMPFPFMLAPPPKKH
jgi:hypothetical protein